MRVKQNSLIRLILTCLFIAVSEQTYAQDALLASIDKNIVTVESNRNLIVKEINFTETDSQQADGGRMLWLYGEDDELVKMVDMIGYSYGRITTIVYLKQAKPVLIIYREENFAWNKDSTGWDYKSLHQVFESKMYVFDWENEEGKTFNTGSRVFSDDVCSVGEFELMIENSLALWRKNR